MLADALGLTGSLFSIALWLPQAALVWRSRATPEGLVGLSAATMWMALTSSVIWTTYAVMTRAFWVGAPNLVTAPLTVMMLSILASASPSHGERHVAPLFRFRSTPQSSTPTHERRSDATTCPAVGAESLATKGEHGLAALPG